MVGWNGPQCRTRCLQKSIDVAALLAVLRPIAADRVSIVVVGAAFGGQIHFSGMWMGYANQGSGQGVAIELNNIKYAIFRPDVIENSDTAIVPTNCDTKTASSPSTKVVVEKRIFNAQYH